MQQMSVFQQPVKIFLSLRIRIVTKKQATVHAVVQHYPETERIFICKFLSST